MASLPDSIPAAEHRHDLPRPHRQDPSPPLSTASRRPTWRCQRMRATTFTALWASDASFPAVFAVVPFLHRHRLYFPLDLHLSSLLHSFFVSGSLLPPLIPPFPLLPSLPSPSQLPLRRLRRCLPPCHHLPPPGPPPRALLPSRPRCLLSAPRLPPQHLRTPDAVLLAYHLDDLSGSRLKPDAPLYSDLITTFVLAALPHAALPLLATAQGLGLTPVLQ